MKPIVKRILLSDGLQLEYREQGDVSGVPVILLHGVTDSRVSFDLVLPHLPSGVRAFALSQRGHGDSDRPHQGYRPRNFAADVAEFSRQLGLGPVVLVGHSMGATNSIRFAIDHPEMLLGLVLLGAFASCGKSPAAVEFYETGVKPLQDPIDPGFVREFQEATLSQGIPEPFLEAVVQESLKVPARVWKAAFQGQVEDDSVGDLSEIRTPTLILWGDQDAFAGRVDQDTLRRGIPNSRLVVYSKIGHALHWEEPQRFAADLTAFVETIKRGSGTGPRLASLPA